MLRRVTLLALTWTAAHGVAWACSCAQPGPAAEELAASDLVVYAEVTKRRDRSLGCTTSSADRITVELDVITAFVGAEDGDRVTVETARSGASCGVPFAEGETWLVYAQGGDAGLCSRTRQVDADDPELDELDELVAGG